MIRQVVSAGLSPQRRALHHGASLEALERPELHVAEPLAYHAVQAQRWEQGLAWSERAAEEAALVSASAAAMLLYQQALACVAHLPPSDALRRKTIDLRLRLAEVAFYVQPGRLGEWLAPAER